MFWKVRKCIRVSKSCPKGIYAWMKNEEVKLWIHTCIQNTHKLFFIFLIVMSFKGEVNKKSFNFMFFFWLKTTVIEYWEKKLNIIYVKNITMPWIEKKLLSIFQVQVIKQLVQDIWLLVAVVFTSAHGICTRKNTNLYFLNYFR